LHFPDSFIKQVNESTDIVDLIGEYIDLERAGATYRGLCPFHNDKNTPNLYVYPSTQSFYCYSCGAGSKTTTSGSDPISFYMDIEEVEWQDAVLDLAERAGLEPPEQELSAKEKKMIEMVEKTEELNRTFWNTLQNNTKGLEYLKSRGIEKEDIDEWRIGMVPSDYDYYKIQDRIAFAIQNAAGRTVGFGYRRFLNDKWPKYLNSKDSLIFKKSRLLLGYDKAKRNIRKEGRAVLVEGYIDVILLHKYGVNNTVGTMGVSLSDHHINMLKRLTNEVVIFVDDDEAGRNFAYRQIVKLKNAGIDVKIVSSEIGDPADTCNAMEDKIVLFIDNKAVFASQFFLERALDEYTKEVTEAQKKAINDVKELFDIAFTPAEKDIYLNRVSNTLGVSKENLIKELELAGKQVETVKRGA